MKAPWFAFYPADWRKDLALQTCSIEARALWFEMLLLMHEARPYGHLVLNGAPPPEVRGNSEGSPREVALISITPRDLSGLLGVPLKTVNRALRELEAKHVFSRTPEGVIFSRRMVRDEKKRQAWAERQRHHREQAAQDPPGLSDKPRRDIKRDRGGDVTPVSRGSSFSSSSSEKAVPQNHLSEPTHPSGVPPDDGVEVKSNGAKHPGVRLARDATIPPKWLAWACDSYSLTEGQAHALFIEFRDYWADQPGDRGLRVNWFPTFKNRLRDLHRKGQLR